MADIVGNKVEGYVVGGNVVNSGGHEERFELFLSSLCDSSPVGRCVNDYVSFESISRFTYIVV